VATLTTQEQLGLEEVFGAIQKRNRLRYELTYLKNNAITRRKNSLRLLKTMTKRMKSKLRYKYKLCRFTSVARFC